MISYYDNQPLPVEGEVNLENVTTPTTTLTDESILGFGKRYNLRKMKDVPADYLHWFYTNVSCNNAQSRAILQYIKAHLAALRKEHTDGIWSRPSHLKD